ncbi:hypothetical protein KOI35_21870 [Actinoplanes bogorensis]|uniref:Uncharacterized protein n=1 Tax=Paractinoplanes bogorensis TaxID=1610840 RepID=A0ABS5YS59_9ACTN|nr:hypothetical protein [Actinoplanes bogorensis]MBU2666151.1 hypothetical protein [Actinoplanes bogorensis]
MPLPSARSVAISAWSVPVLVVGQFAMVALIPVLIVLITVLRDARLHALRWWAVALAAVYATALILWAALPDRAPSLSKDLHPATATLIIATAAATAIACHVLRRSSRSAANPA